MKSKSYNFISTGFLYRSQKSEVRNKSQAMLKMTLQRNSPHSSSALLTFLAKTKQGGAKAPPAISLQINRFISPADTPPGA